jgi:hypothetical protein
MRCYGPTSNQPVSVSLRDVRSYGTVIVPLFHFARDGNTVTGHRSRKSMRHSSLIRLEDDGQQRYVDWSSGDAGLCGSLRIVPKYRTWTQWYFRGIFSSFRVVLQCVDERLLSSPFPIYLQADALNTQFLMVSSAFLQATHCVLGNRMHNITSDLPFVAFH